MSWELTGNAGTNPAVNFLGTNDNQPLVIKTNGTEVMRVNVPDVPSSRLEITAQDGLAITGFQPFVTLRDANAGNARSVVQGVSGDIVFIPDSFIGRGAAMVVKTGSGNVGIGTDSPTAKLEVQGDVKVTGDIVLTNADCAEEFDIEASTEVEPGTVMVLDHDGTLHQSASAYDKRVAGVISGGGDYQPGIILDKQQVQPNRKPVALVGKAYCKVDARYAPIEVGDLLTTSLTPGHAMKAVDPLKAFGSIIGKALRPLEAGRGMIPILVALQ